MRFARLILLLFLLFASSTFVMGAGRRCAGCVPESNGRIARSRTARHQFEKSHPCPSTGRGGGACPGYVVDHVVPLERGGADDSSNMQWQTIADAKAKDKVE